MDRPKPLQPDRRFPLWIGFLLGIAGVLVSVAGVYELLRQRPTQAAPAQAAQSIHRPEEARIAQRQALVAQMELARQHGVAERRRQQEAEAAALRARGRCMDGVLIIKEGNEIRSAGRCAAAEY